MNRIASLVVTAAFGLAIVMIAQAGETTPCSKSAASASNASAKSGCCSKSKTTEPTSVATTASATSIDADESGCVIKASIERAMKMLPQMAYKVGDKTTACAMSAKSQASSSGDSIVYVVNGEEIGCRMSAMNKLADAINADVEKLANVVAVVDDEVIYCRETAAKVAADKKVSPHYLVAGVEFDCPKKAAWMSERVASKIKEIRSSDGCCAKSGATATTASVKVEGCCGKGECAKCAGAKAKADAETAVITSATTSGCDKSKATASTASAKSTGCCKSSASASTASDKSEGCCKSAAEIAAGKGCGSKGGCAKAAAAVASNDTPCGSKDKADAKVASADAGCPKAQAALASVAVAEADGDETPALSRAKRMIRDIVEYVVQENGRTSEAS